MPDGCSESGMHLCENLLWAQGAQQAHGARRTEGARLAASDLR